MIHYILQVVVFQLLFLAVYDMFLKKETFFSANRVYLLVTSVLSLVLPFFKILALRETINPKFYVELPAIFLGSTSNATDTQFNLLPVINLQTPQDVTINEIFIILYLIGIAAFSILFFIKLMQIAKLKKLASPKNLLTIQYYEIPESEMAFSFLNQIFVGETISENQKEIILLHENIHIRQKHSYDLIWFEILKIIFWFNPLTYIYQSRIRLLHEFIADAKVVQHQNKAAYYQNLLSEVFQTSTISFTNTFFKKSLIKNRIVMLQKSKSKKIFQLKYLLMLPLIGGMLFYTSCSEDRSNVDNQSLQEKIISLNREIEAKGDLSEEEKAALNNLIIRALPEGATYTEKTAKGPIVSVTKMPSSDYDNGESDVPFTMLDKFPVYKGCEGLEGEAAKNCFSENLSKFVAENFNTEIAVTEHIKGLQQIYVQFKIDKTGNIIDVKARASNKLLQDEALRVINLIPQLTPGEKAGKTVGVLYALPIQFEIKE